MYKNILVRKISFVLHIFKLVVFLPLLCEYYLITIWESTEEWMNKDHRSR